MFKNSPCARSRNGSINSKKRSFDSRPMSAPRPRATHRLSEDRGTLQGRGHRGPVSVAPPPLLGLLGSPFADPFASGESLIQGHRVLIPVVRVFFQTAQDDA